MDEALILATRNIKAMAEGMRQFESMRSNDSQRVEQLMSTVTMQAQQIQKLQAEVAVLRARAMGAGPTT